jgi:hypothetical protein
MDRRHEQSSRDSNRHSYSRQIERSYRSERYSNQSPDDSSTKYPSLSTSSTRSAHRELYTSRTNTGFRSSINEEEKVEKTDSKPSNLMKQDTSQEQIVLSYPSHIPQQIVLSYPSQVSQPQPQPQQQQQQQQKEQVISFSLEEEEEQERLLKSKKQPQTLQQQQNTSENQVKEQEPLEPWVMHTSDKGEIYYYNRLTRESAWQLPTSAQPNNHKEENGKDKVIDIEEEEEGDKVKEDNVWVMHTSDRGEPYYYNKLTRQSVWEIPLKEKEAQNTKTKNNGKVGAKEKPQEEQLKQRSVDNNISKPATVADKIKEHSRNDDRTPRRRAADTNGSVSREVPTGSASKAAWTEPTPKSVPIESVPKAASTRSISKTMPSTSTGSAPRAVQTRTISSPTVPNGSVTRAVAADDRVTNAKENSRSNSKEKERNYRNDSGKSRVETSGNREAVSKSRSVVEQESLKRKRAKSPHRSYSRIRHSEPYHYRSRSPPPPPSSSARGYYHYYRSPSPPPPPLPPSPDRYYVRRYDDYNDRRLPPPPPPSWYYEQNEHLIRQERLRSRERYGYDIRRYNHSHSDPYYHRQRYRSPPPPSRY